MRIPFHIIICLAPILAYVILQQMCKNHIRECVAWCSSEKYDLAYRVFYRQAELNVEERYRFSFDGQDMIYAKAIIAEFLDYLHNQYFSRDWRNDINPKILKTTNEDYFWSSLLDFLDHNKCADTVREKRRVEWVIGNGKADLMFTEYGMIHQKMLYVVELETNRRGIAVVAPWYIENTRNSIETNKPQY